jgi:hypothetical protein
MDRFASTKPVSWRRIVVSLLVVAGFVAISAEAVYACKYSVRDVGFANPQSSTYQLQFFTLPSRLELVETTTEAAKIALADSNVAFSSGGDIPAALKSIPDAKQSRQGLWLVGPTGRAKPLLLETGGKLDDVKRLVAQLQEIVDSPLRSKIASQLTSHYATVIVVDGEDANENTRARAAAEQLVKQIADVRGKLEKPVKEGPSLEIVTRDQQPRERWFLWGLGIDEDQKHAAIAFIFGQFRRSAKVYAGDEIDVPKMFSSMAALGYSCECNLDRATLFGPALPHRWTVADRKRTMQAVGFDPHDSQVRAEINALLAKQPLIEAGELNVTYEQLMLGLKEVPLDEDDRASPSAPPQSSPVPSTIAVAPTKVDPTSASPAAANTADATANNSWIIGAAIAVVAAVAGLTFLRRGRS